MPVNQLLLNLDDEDLALLIAASEADKLNRTDTIRRAIRAYAKGLGVKPATKRAR